MKKKSTFGLGWNPIPSDTVMKWFDFQEYHLIYKHVLEYEV